MRSQGRAAIALIAALTVCPSCRSAPPEHVRVVPQVNPVKPRRVIFSPTDEAQLLVLEASGLVGVWDVSNPTRPELYASIAAGAIDTCFTPDGKGIITAGRDGRVRRWTPEGQLVWASDGGHAGMARSVAAGADLIVSGGEDGIIRFWKPDGSAIGAPLRAHDAAVVSIAVAPNGDLASLGDDETIRRWTHGPASESHAPVSESPAILFEPKVKKPAQFYQNLPKFDPRWGWDHSLAFSPGGDVLAGVGFDEAVRLWLANGSAPVAIDDAHEKLPARALAFSPSGTVLASAGFDGKVRLWNLDGTPRAAPIQAHDRVVYSVSFSAKGDRLATAGLDDRVRLWNLDGSKVAELPPGSADRIVNVAVAPEEPALVAADDTGIVQRWTFDAKPLGAPLAVEKGAGRAMAFSPHGDALAASGADGTVRVWNRDGSLRGKPLPGVRRLMGTLAFTPDGQTLAVGSETLELWGPNERLLQLPPSFREGDWFTSFSFEPKGGYFVAGSWLGRLQVFNADGTVRTPAHKLPKEYIRAVALSPQGDFFASVGGDESVVRLWNLDNSPHGDPLEGHQDRVKALAFSPTQPLLASGGVDGTVRLWHLPSRQSDVIDVGLQINQLGFWRDLLWVRTDTNSVVFYDAERRLVASMLLRRNAALTLTQNGWFSGSDSLAQAVRLFPEKGSALPEAQAVDRRSAERVLKAFAH